MASPATFLRRFARARRGSAAVEFAFVAAPFVALVFAIIELGLVFLVQTSLDNAISDTARLIRTGELQASSGTATTFKAAICDNMSWLGNGCASNLNIDVRVFTSFAGQTPPNPAASGTFVTTGLTFSPGVGRDIVLVRGFYQWDLITPLLNDGLVNLGGSKRLITSTVTFRNEPF